MTVRDTALELIGADALMRLENAGLHVARAASRSLTTVTVPAEQVREGDVLLANNGRHAVAGPLDYDEDGDPYLPLETSLRRFFVADEQYPVRIVR